MTIAMPPWLTWQDSIAFTSFLAAWVGLYLSVRRELRERTVLRFKLNVFEVMLIEDEFNSVLEVCVTNAGTRPITVDSCCCIFDLEPPNGRKRVISEWVMQKLSMGESYIAQIVLPQNGLSPSLKAVFAVDSTGKRWNAPRSEMVRLRATGFSS